MSVQDAIKFCRDNCRYNTVEDFREALEILAKADLSWHPDDDISDIVFDQEINESDRAKLVWIDNALWDFCNAQELDIYEETMQAHVRAHGEKSCFWPEQ